MMVGMAQTLQDEVAVGENEFSPRPRISFGCAGRAA